MMTVGIRYYCDRDKPELPAESAYTPQLGQASGRGVSGLTVGRRGPWACVGPAWRPSKDRAAPAANRVSGLARGVPRTSRRQGAAASKGTR